MYAYLRVGSDKLAITRKPMSNREVIFEPLLNFLLVLLVNIKQGVIVNTAVRILFDLRLDINSAVVLYFRAIFFGYNSQ
jgi:hypothetical protein